MNVSIVDIFNQFNVNTSKWPGKTCFFCIHAGPLKIRLGSNQVVPNLKIFIEVFTKIVIVRINDITLNLHDLSTRSVGMFS